MEFVYSADMRYVGQGHELNVWLTREEFDVQLMARRFHQAHLDRYTYSRDELPIQLVNLRATATGRVNKLRLQPLESRGTADAAGALKETRDVHLEGKWVRTRVYDRERLFAGMDLRGPAIVEEMGSTTLISPGWTGRVDSVGNILLHAGGEA